MSQFVHPEFLRIGDGERDRALQALAEHFAAGRLTTEEFDQRSDQVWKARTTADLRPLFTDLPGGLPLTPPVPAGWQPQRLPAAVGRRTRGLPFLWRVLFAVILVATVASHPWVLAVIAVVWVWARRSGRHRGPNVRRM